MQFNMTRESFEKMVKPFEEDYISNIVELKEKNIEFNSLLKQYIKTQRNSMYYSCFPEDIPFPQQTFKVPRDPREEAKRIRTMFDASNDDSMTVFEKEFMRLQELFSYRASEEIKKAAADIEKIKKSIDNATKYNESEQQEYISAQEFLKAKEKERKANIEEYTSGRYIAATLFFVIIVGIIFMVVT